jgi:hypothetical protein
MGVSSDGLLVYGYDLGELDDWEPAWQDEDEDFAESVMTRLLVASGFTETDWQVDGYFARKSEAEERLGVELVTHCSYDYPMYVLGAAEFRAYRGYPKALDLAELSNPEVLSGWNAKLASALEVLEITPEQGHPQWILCSIYG